MKREASKSTFHPTFRDMLTRHEVIANSYLIQFSDLRGSQQAAERPILISDVLEFNASVGTASDGYPIYQVTAGAIAAISDLAASLAADERFVREVEITGEIIETRSAHTPDQFIDYSYMMDGPTPLPLIPFRFVKGDRRRNALAGIIAELTLKFLVIHEQMHFLRGHLHYLCGVDSPTTYEEVPRVIPKLLSGEESRCLELDADSGAFHFLLSYFNSGRHINLVGEFTDLFSDPYGWSRIASIAALTVMLLLSLSDGRRTLGTHPSAQTRMLNLIDVHWSYLRDHPDIFDLGYLRRGIAYLFDDIQVIAETIRVEAPSPIFATEWLTKPPNEFVHACCIDLRDLRLRFTELLPKLR